MPGLWRRPNPRLLYSTVDEAVNAATVEAAIARRGADKFSTRRLRRANLIAPRSR